MSALRSAGSTRHWRRIRAAVLVRDSDAQGVVRCHWCGVVLTHHDVRLGTHAHVDHLDERADHPGQPDDIDRLVSACAVCDASRGGRFGARRRGLNTSREW